MCGQPLKRSDFFNDLYTVLCHVCFVKESFMPTRITTDLTAYCATCPAADDVTGMLVSLGFALVFQMKADDTQAYLQLAPLPAQFHYRDSQGTEVIYLAGVDHENERPSPPYASRFWLYAGADGRAHERAAEVLASTWSLRWLPLDELSTEDLSALEAVA
jgi:hypothetical protein